MNPEINNPYDSLPESNETVLNYKPKFLARGGDHLVYSVEDHPDVVIKASSFVVKDILSENSEHGDKLDTLTADQEERLYKEISDKNSQIRLLRESFGVEHTLKERRSLMKVPVSNEILEEIFKGDWKKRQVPVNAKDLNEAWTIVIIQENAPEINDQDHLGLYFGSFLEERLFDKDEYAKLNNALIRFNNESSEKVADLLLKLQDNPDTHALSDLLTACQNDENLKQSVIEFIKKTIEYTKQTGNILALAGKDNVILSKENDTWNYLLIDALPIHSEPVFNDAKDAIHRSLNGEQITKKEKTLIMKALNFTRTINGLSIALGLSDKLEIICQEDKDKDIDFSEII